MKTKIAAALTLLMVLTGLGPVTSASAATITKTFTITKSDGSAYPGVLVALYGDFAYGSQPNRTQIVQTNASGVATIQVSEPDFYYRYAVQPPAGDTSHAPRSGELVLGATESFNLQLSAANVRVQVQTHDGQPSPIWTEISYPNSEGVGDVYSNLALLRSGAFGIDFPTALPSSARLIMEVYPPSDAPGNFYSYVGLAKSSSGDPLPVTLFTDETYSQVISPTVVGGQSVFVINLTGPNLVGAVNNSTGGALSLPSGAFGKVDVYAANQNGEFWGGNQVSYSAELSANGGFQARLLQTPSGKYFPLFLFSGSLSLPTFVGSPFYINSEGNYSMNEAGPFVSPSSFRYSTNLPSASSALRISIKNPNTGANLDSSISLVEQSNYGESWYQPNPVSSGLFSFAMRDGSYTLWVRSSKEALVEQGYDVLIDQGQFTIKTKQGQTVTPNQAGVYELTPQVPNLLFRIVDPADSARKFWAGMSGQRLDVEQDPFGSGNINGLIPFNLQNGEYRLTVDVNEGLLCPRDYLVTVTGNSITVRDTITNNLISPTNGVYLVNPAPANVLFKPVDSNSQVFTGSNGWVSARIDRKVNGVWRNETYVYPSGNGQFAFRAKATGDYRATLDPSGRSDVATTVHQFTVENLNQVKDLGNLLMKSTNFRFQIFAAGTSEPLSNASVTVTPSPTADPNEDSGYAYTDWNTKIGGMLFENVGNFTLRVRKPWDYPSNLGADKTYTVNVVSNGSGGFTPTINGITPVNGVFRLDMGLPNVTGKILDPAGQAITLTGESGLGINVQRQIDGLWKYFDAYANPTKGGEFGFSITQNGTYRLQIDPYELGDVARTYSPTFTVTDLNKSGTVANFADLRLVAPTAKFGVTLPGSTTRLSGAYIDIQRVQENAEWVDSIYSDSKGISRFSAPAAGTYDFIVKPDWNNRSQAVSKTYRGTVTGTGPSDYQLSIPGLTAVNGVFNLSLGSPNLRGKVVLNNGNSINLSNGGWIWIRLEKYDVQEDEWWGTSSQINFSSNGSFAGQLNEAGTYRLRITPYQLTNQTAVYTSSFTVTSAELATFNRNFGDVRLGTPNLVGEVLAPTGTTKIADAQIVFLDAVTGRELWQYSQATDADGKWIANLPAGKYSIYARAPWRSNSFGDSALVENVVVAQNGSVTIGGTPASSNVQIRLSVPTWSGTVVDPTNNSVMPYANVCLGHQENNQWRHVCSTTNDQGQWALSKPFFFTGFNDTTSLSIYPRTTGNLSEKRLQGALAVSQALGSYTANTTYQNIVLSPAQPNVSITVKAGQANAANVWVNVIKPSVGWLGGGVTDQNGVAKIYIPNLTGPINIEAFVNGVPELRDSYATTKKSMTALEVTSATTGSNFATTLNLATPNLRVIVYEPGATPSTPGDAVAGTYVSIYNETDKEWDGSYNSNALGEIPISLTAPATGTRRYKLTIHAPENNPDLLLRSTYIATVQVNGNLTLTTESGTAVTAVGGKFPLVLTAPTVTGTVSNPDGVTRVSEARVIPTDISTRYDLWERAVYTNRTGEFGVVLPNGSFYLVANPAWRGSEFAKSARCQVDIFNGSLVSPDSDCISNGKINLKFREPNVKFKLVHNGQAVANSYVHLNVGNWYVNAQSRSDGTVALFVDPQEIAAANPNMSGSQDIKVQVDPIRSISGIVGWSCNSGDSMPLCDQLTDVTIGQGYSVGTNGVLNDVSFVRPNTSLRVTAPGGTQFKADSWVNLYKQENGWLRWLGSDNSDTNGWAEFNLTSAMIADSSARYTIHVDPPWNERKTSARMVYRDLNYAQLNNQSFALAAPNLKLDIRQAFNDAVSRWSSINVERKVVNQDNSSYWTWHNWTNTNELGEGSLFLESPGSYRLTVYPGSGARGSTVTCELDVATTNNVTTISKVQNACDAGGTITDSTLKITLSAGNLQGKIFQDDGITGLAGAIVFAEALNDSNELIPGMTAEAVTNTDGSYGLQLSNQYRWQIKVFYINPPGAANRWASMLTPQYAEKSELSSTKTLNITLRAQ